MFANTLILRTGGRARDVSIVSLDCLFPFFSCINYFDFSLTYDVPVVLISNLIP
jgi:hypothetical protein